MTALHDPALDPGASIVDFCGVLRARAAAAGLDAAPPRAAANDLDSPDNIVAFPAAATARPPLRQQSRAAIEPDLGDFDPVKACEDLVERFRTMHEALIDLVVTCRDFETAGNGTLGDASELLVNLATLSMSTDRFQEQLVVAVDGAFR
jgi:hypothetical protein